MKKQSLLASSTIMVLAQVWGALLTLAVTPYVVRSLGAEGYGLFSLVIVLANYVAAVDLGLGWGVIKFVAECAAKKDFQQMEGIIRVSAWMTLLLGVFFALALILLAPWLANSVFNASSARTDVLKIGIALGGTMPGLILFSNLLGGVLKGLQRFDLAVGPQLLLATARMVGYVLVLKAGYGLIGLWVLTILSMFLCVLVYAFSIRRLMPEVSLLPKFGKSFLKTVLSFSIFGLATRLLTMPYFYLDKLFIGALLPVSALSFYVIPFQLSQRMGGIGGATASVLFPPASERSDDRERLRSLYRRTAPVIYCLIVPMVLVAVTIGPEFLRYWIGEEFGRLGRLPLILTSVGFGFSVLGSVDGTFLEAVGKPRIVTAIYAGVALVGLPLCYVLTGTLGINGTAVTICGAFCVGGALEVACQQLLVMKDWWYLGNILARCALLASMGLGVGWASRLVICNLWSSIVSGVLLYLVLMLVAALVFRTSGQFRAYLARAIGRMFRMLVGFQSLVMAVVRPAKLR